MFVLSVIIVAGCLINAFITGFSMLNIVYLVLSGLFLIVQLPFIKSRLFKDKKLLKINISALISIVYVILFALSGVALNPFKAEAKFTDKMEKAQTLTGDKKYMQAQALVDELLVEDATNVDVLIIAGTLYMEQKNYDRALVYLNQAYAVAPYSENVLYNLSVVKYKQFLAANGAGSPAEALSYMETLVKQSPRLYSANLYAGQMASELQQFKKAKYYLLNAQLLKPEIPQTYYSMAKVNYSLYEYKDALTNIEIALSNDPGTELREELTALQTTVKKEAGGVFGE